MERLDNTYRFRNFLITVFRGLPDSNDLNWDEKVEVKLRSNETEHTGYLSLVPLWNIVDEVTPNMEYKEKFSEGDYFQHTFSNRPPRCGIGSVIHDFLLDYKEEFQIRNVYSTNFNEDCHVLSDDAKYFWKKRVSKDKAEFVEDLCRYKIKFENEK
jgi:hypothetical protein